MTEFVSETLPVIGIAVALLGVYFIPSVVTLDREVWRKLPIVVFNVLVGWTVIGWAVALVWACRASDAGVEHPNGHGHS